MGLRSSSILAVVSLLIVGSRSLAGDVLFRDAPCRRTVSWSRMDKRRPRLSWAAKAAPFYRWVAEEVQRHLRQLTGAELPIVPGDTAPADTPLIVLGGPQNNPLSASAEQKQLVKFAGLKQDGFIVQTIDLAGQPAVVAGGNDEASTMYAAYELLERLGIAFQITGDIIPQQRPNLKLPAASLRREPALKYRGLHIRHFVMPWMGLDDFRRTIDQIAKLKGNYLEFDSVRG